MTEITYSNLKTFFNLICGQYTPLVYANNTYIDVPYICGAVLFILIVYFFFKALLGLIYR